MAHPGDRRDNDDNLNTLSRRACDLRFQKRRNHVYDDVTLICASGLAIPPGIGSIESRTSSMSESHMLAYGSST